MLKNTFGKIKSLQFLIITFTLVLLIGAFKVSAQDMVANPTPEVSSEQDIIAEPTLEISNTQSNNLKDTDFDGVSDDAELNVYHTNIYSEDTDSDGVLDYQEILDGTDPNDAKSNKLASAENQASAVLGEGAPLMWYLGRITGIVSFIMFTVVICMGLLMTSKVLLKFRFMRMNETLGIHMFTATFVAFILLVIHICSFIFDDFIQLKPIEIFVPFLLKRELVSSVGVNIGIPVALGVIALYIVIVLLVTSHFRNKLVSNKTWRMIHYSSFLFYILFILHGYFAGSDSNAHWMQAIYATSLGVVSFLIILRIFGKKYFLPKPKPKPVNPSDSSNTRESSNPSSSGNSGESSNSPDSPSPTPVATTPVQDISQPSA